MGTPLTGLEIRDTYDALIKIGDNGPIGATAKYIGDGLGNDSKLSLSTGNIGINTTTPSTDFHVNGSVRITGAIYDSNNSVGTAGQILSSTVTGTDWVSLSEITGVDGTGTANYVAKWSDTDTITNSQIFDNGTNVGIGTATPAAKLDVVGTLAVSGNATFDTNTLFVDATNNRVGIGNASPLNQLDLNATGSPALFDAGLSGVQNGGTIELNYIASGRSGGRDGVHIFKTGVDSTGGTERMRITGTGNVGIGTSSPTATLNIKSTTSNNSDNLAQVLTNSEFRLQYRADDISSLYIGGLGSERGFLQGVNAAENAGADISLNPFT
jgi:hypothetical protein